MADLSMFADSGKSRLGAEPRISVSTGFRLCRCGAA
jgi:hypothetical protein